VNSDVALFVERHGSSSLPGFLLRECLRRSGHRHRRSASCEYGASGRIHVAPSLINVLSWRYVRFEVPDCCADGRLLPRGGGVKSSLWHCALHLLSPCTC